MGKMHPVETLKLFYIPCHFIQTDNRPTTDAVPIEHVTDKMLSSFKLYPSPTMSTKLLSCL